MARQKGPPRLLKTTLVADPPSKASRGGTLYNSGPGDSWRMEGASQDTSPELVCDLKLLILEPPTPGSDGSSSPTDSVYSTSSESSSSSVSSNSTRASSVSGDPDECDRGGRSTARVILDHGPVRSIQQTIYDEPGPPSPDLVPFEPFKESYFEELDLSVAPDVQLGDNESPGLAGSLHEELGRAGIWRQGSLRDDKADSDRIPSPSYTWRGIPDTLFLDDKRLRIVIEDALRDIGTRVEAVSKAGTEDVAQEVFSVIENAALESLMPLRQNIKDMESQLDVVNGHIQGLNGILENQSQAVNGTLKGLNNQAVALDRHLGTMFGVFNAQTDFLASQTNALSAILDKQAALLNRAVPAICHGCLSNNNEMYHRGLREGYPGDSCVSLSRVEEKGQLRHISPSAAVEYVSPPCHTSEPTRQGSSQQNLRQCWRKFWSGWQGKNGRRTTLNSVIYDREYTKGIFLGRCQQ